MEQWRKQFKLWESKFQASEYSFIREELQDLNLAVKDKALLAYRCLISLNVTSKKNLIDDIPITTKYLDDLHQLATLCCNLIRVAWNYMECDFVTNVFYISKILLHRKYVVEACELCQLVFKYFEELPNAKLDFKANEINVPSRYIVLFLHATSTFQLNSDEGEKVFYLWNIILSSSKERVVRANFTNVLDYFAPFVQNISMEDFIRVEHRLISLIKKLMIGIKSNKSAEKMLFKFLLTDVSKFCEFSLAKNKSNFLMDILEHSKMTDSVELCLNIYRICSGICGKDDVSAVIAATSVQLQDLISTGSSVLNDVVYCAAIIIVKMSLQNLSAYSLDEVSVGTFFTIILTLARRLKDIDIHELLSGKKEGNRKIDNGTIAILSIDLMSCCTVIKDVNLGNETIYESMLEAQKMAISCMECVDEKRKEQLKQFFGPCCVNMCKMYIVVDSQTQNIQCKNLCYNALQYFSTLPNTDLRSPLFEKILNKLVMCLCRSYRSLEMYEEWMKTAFAWSLISPANSDTFLEQFCAAKHKLSCTSTKSPLMDCTFLELLKMTPKLWKHPNLENFNAAKVCAVELKAYLKNNLMLSKPMTVLLKRLKYEDSADVIRQGIFYYAKFRLKLLRFREENEAEVKSLIPNKTDPSTQEDAYVLGTYNFHNQKDVLKILNTAVDKWAAAVEKCRNSPSPKEDLNELELSYLKEAALVYRLYCDSSKEVEVWKLLYVTSKYRGDEEMAVYAVSNLMCTSWKINPRWIKEVEERMLEKVGESLKLRYRLDSYNRGFVEGFTPEMKESLQEITQQTANEHNLEAKYCYLMARIYFRRILARTADPYMMCFTAVSELKKSLRNAKWSQSFAEICESESLLLDVSVFMIARCTEKFELKDAESFALEPFKMVQSMGLPLRTCQLLNLSSFLDTLVGRLEECYVKLQYASSILNHNVKPVTKVRNEPQISSLASDFRFVISDYDVEFEENPALNSALRFEMPAFATHPKNCECDICVNGEYLRLYCELMSVYGIYFRLLKKWYQADEFFQGVFKLLRYAKKRVDISELKASTLIQCGNYWAAQDRFKEANLCNHKVQKMFDADLRDNFALGNMNLDQYWQLFAVEFFEEVKASRTVKERKAITRICTPERVEHPAANEKLKNAVKSAAITPCPRKSRKVLLFDDFGSPPSSSTTEKNELFVTPPASVMDLPASVQKQRTTRRPPSSSTTEKNDLFVSPPATAMDLPASVQKQRSSRRPPSSSMTERNKLIAPSVQKPRTTRRAPTSSTTEKNKSIAPPLASVTDLPPSVQKRRTTRRQK